MITVITRTSGRPRRFDICRKSVLMQGCQPFHLVISDTADENYMRGDKVLRVQKQEGRGHNLYLNEARHHIPPSHPWVMFLDDDDQFTGPCAVQEMVKHINSAPDFFIEDTDMAEDSLLLWQVQFPGNVLIPGTAFGHPPAPGNISGIGFCFHSKHWVDWPAESLGDFHVINTLYSQLCPVWIYAVLTGLQAGPGMGLREDL